MVDVDQNEANEYNSILINTTVLPSLRMQVHLGYIEDSFVVEIKSVVEISALYVYLVRPYSFWVAKRH